LRIRIRSGQVHGKGCGEVSFQLRAGVKGRVKIRAEVKVID